MYVGFMPKTALYDHMTDNFFLRPQPPPPVPYGGGTRTAPAQEGHKVLWWVCLFVCLSVCLSARITRKPHTAELHRILCACCAWSVLSLTALPYVMYFRFCGWRHVFYTAQSMSHKIKHGVILKKFTRWRYQLAVSQLHRLPAFGRVHKNAAPEVEVCYTSCNQQSTCSFC